MSWPGRRVCRSVSQGSRRGGGEDHQVGGGQGDVDLRHGAGLPAVGAGGVGGEGLGVRVDVVVDQAFADICAASCEEVGDGSADDTGADEEHRLGAVAVGEGLHGERGGRRGAGGADAGRLQAGERVAGLRVVQQENGGGTRQVPAHVLRIAGDPLEAGDRCVAAEVGGQGDDPGAGIVREAQEVAVGVHGGPAAVLEVGLPHEVQDVRRRGVDDILGNGAVDHVEG